MGRKAKFDQGMKLKAEVSSPITLAFLKSERKG